MANQRLKSETRKTFYFQVPIFRRQMKFVLLHATIYSVYDFCFNYITYTSQGVNNCSSKRAIFQNKNVYVVQEKFINTCNFQLIQNCHYSD
jgi:hypothetical protein